MKVAHFAIADMAVDKHTMTDLYPLPSNLFDLKSRRWQDAEKHVHFSDGGLIAFGNTVTDWIS